ncbi:hypothetical protein FRACYDRAFT_246303 [Fragilariopsis cylindrus CCMP1102]|uniref:Helicase-associated domain-containing protein n=1 Tax=Fragilariopsis cylindrus CCMP1102 TaxID=635003 RepID=A0A1E7EYZ1_9STRA|nr:hypothetical protein FRACYDRAFT_246303 [Fragilariopsis cylindrus CCMP1102]|eukprot:OEU11191.1 hypothetical protein FRACYDRAFT_246303 [Fragilariopsis cylindrus CCMP1102]
MSNKYNNNGTPISTSSISSSSSSSANNNNNKIIMTKESSTMSNMSLEKKVEQTLAEDTDDDKTTTNNNNNNNNDEENEDPITVTAEAAVLVVVPNSTHQVVVANNANANIKNEQVPLRPNNKYNPSWLVILQTIPLKEQMQLKTLKRRMIQRFQEKNVIGRCTEARRNPELRYNHSMYLTEDHYTTVLIVRDPFERAYSAYKNSDSNTNIYLNDGGDGVCSNTTNCTFEVWVNKLIHFRQSKNSAVKNNEHFKPQIEIAQFHKIHYHYKLRMTSQIDLTFLFQDLMGFNNGIPKEHINSSSSSASKNNTANGSSSSSSSSSKRKRSGRVQQQKDNDNVTITTATTTTTKDNNNSDRILKLFESISSKTMNQLAIFYKNDLKLWQELLDYGTPRSSLPGEEITLYDYYISDQNQKKMITTQDKNNKNKKNSNSIDYSFGHCLVPNQYPDNPSLAEWVKRQRYQYKLKGMGKYTHMSNDRMIALEKSGFVWNSHDAVWEERLKELKEFKHVNHGNTNVPSFYPPNPPLAVWVNDKEDNINVYVKANQQQSQKVELTCYGYKTSSDDDNDDNDEENENINYNNDDAAIKIIDDGDRNDEDEKEDENTNEDENENDDDDDDNGAIIGKENIDEMRIKIKAKDDKEWKLIHSGIMASIGTRITKKSKNKSKRNIGSRSRYIGTFKNERDAALAVKIAWKKIDDMKSQQLVDDDERTLQASDYREWKLLRSKVLASIGTRNANKNSDKRNTSSDNNMQILI